MPELPEAETIVRGLDGCVSGKKIVAVRSSGYKLRREVDIRQLKSDCLGQKVIRFFRRGKAVLAELGNGKAIIVQLGMTGACRVCPVNAEALSHEHVFFTLSGRKEWRFEDPRRFGMVESFDLTDESTWPDFLRRLGVEPLSDDFDAGYLFRVSRKRTRNVKEFLLDQTIVAGIGNIYASEILFRSKIRPERRASDLSRKDCRNVVENTKKVLLASIEAGGTTISDYKAVDGSEGKFERELKIYGRDRELCFECDTEVRKIVQGGRSTFYCPKCQT